MPEVYKQRTSLSKSRQLQDLILAFIVKACLTILLVVVLSRLRYSRPSLFLLSLFSGVLINSFVVFLLNAKYPVKIMVGTNKGKIFKYTLIGTSICLFINFPYSIWGGRSEVLPLEYTYFVGYAYINRVLFILVLCLLAPLAEELLFRGLFYRLLKYRYDVFWGAVVSTALYTLFHHFEVRNFIFIVIPAFVYVYVYEKSKSILASILTHSLNNTLWFLFVYWGIRR
jgi:membrane protease YdiL (CAAX protease family)